MKRRVNMLLFALLLAGCSVTNRIMVTNHEEEGLKNIRLIQSPEVRAVEAASGRIASSIKDISTVYLLEEKIAIRPRIILETDLSTQKEVNKADGAIIIILDNEDIPLQFYVSATDSLQMSSDFNGKEKFQQKYVIPENLWISIVHAKEIAYRISVGEDTPVQIILNQKEKEKLSEFMQMAIQQRDLRFPAVPEGQVKW